MLQTQVTLNEAISYLNELIELDRITIQSLSRKAAKCNEALAEHPAVQVGTHKGGTYVGLLGVLNGLFGVDEDGWGSIVFVYEDGRLVKADRAEKYHDTGSSDRRIDNDGTMAEHG